MDEKRNNAGIQLTEGHFYFIKDSFYTQFSGRNLLENKGVGKMRPCMLVKIDEQFDGIYWFVPISSKVSKYKPIYERSLARYKRCHTIAMGSFLGDERAFLIQNMFPAQARHIEKEMLHEGQSISVDEKLQQRIIGSSKLMLRINLQGKQGIFTDPYGLCEQILLEQARLDAAQLTPDGIEAARHEIKHYQSSIEARQKLLDLEKKVLQLRGDLLAERESEFETSPQASTTIAPAPSSAMRTMICGAVQTAKGATDAMQRSAVGSNSNVNE